MARQGGAKVEELIEQPQEQAKPKKGGKLLVVVVLALVLAGGGYFAMKSKSGSGAKPALKLGEIVEIPKEFLVPLRGQSSYLRTDIALHLAEGFDSHALEKTMAAVRHTINMKLMSKSLRDVQEIDDLRKLQRELAWGINKVLAKAHGAEEKSKPNKNAKPEKHPDWDSNTGPVLKVYFTTFATQ